MRLPSPARGVERAEHTQPQAPLAAGAVQPSLTGKCYDNPTCENSFLPGGGSKVHEVSTVTQCYNTVGNQGAWKAAINTTDQPTCYPLATNYNGLRQREQLRLGNFF